MSFKVIDVGTIGKLVGSAGYDKQQVCVYMQPFSRYRWANSGKITLSKGEGVPLFDALVRGESLHPVAPNYLIRN